MERATTVYSFCELRPIQYHFIISELLVVNNVDNIHSQEHAVKDYQHVNNYNRKLLKLWMILSSGSSSSSMQQQQAAASSNFFIYPVHMTPSHKAQLHHSSIQPHYQYNCILVSVSVKERSICMVFPVLMLLLVLACSNSLPFDDAPTVKN